MPETKTVLLVDDDSFSLKAVENLLKSFGYGTVTASSGSEALEKMNRNIHLVLLDSAMPGIDGFEVAHRIRENPEYGDVPIIMLAGLTGKEDRLMALQSGANDFVSKPPDRVELEIVIASHLKLKEGQDKRRESDARYRMLVENSPVGILCCNRTGEITERNGAAENFFGISSNGQGSPQNLFDNPDMKSSGVSDFLRSCLESHEMVTKKTAIVTKDDKRFKLSVVPVRDRGGCISGLQVVSQNISDHKSADDLSAKKSRLRAFAEMARGAERYFSEGLKYIDDQISTGLTAIDPGANGEVRHAFENIRVYSRQASQTLGLLRKLAGGYGRRDTQKYGTFNFSDAIREALESVKLTWKSEPTGKVAAINLECDFVEDCFLEGQRPEIVELAAHLIRNAADAMPQGGNLRVKTFLVGDLVALEVQDDGVGMTKRQIRRIGTPFWTSKQSGIGLGLAVGFGIIRRNFGTVSISTKKGQGSRFLVKFPLKPGQRGEIEESTEELFELNPKTLFVDPDKTLKGMLAARHQDHGTMYFARSVQEATEIIHEKNVDAIVCSEALSTTQVEKLSKQISVFFASKGAVRPPIIMLAGPERLDGLNDPVSKAYVDSVVTGSVHIGDLLENVTEVIRSVHGRPLVAGNLGQLDILDVIQMMLLSRKQLIVEIISATGERGLLYISNGEILHAECGESEGEEAAYWALCLQYGSFATLAWAEPQRITIRKAGQLLLMEAAQRRDEETELGDGGPDDTQ